MRLVEVIYMDVWSHNPYFNRWFSAIKLITKKGFSGKSVTILILIDGFLQYEYSSI